MKWLSTDSHPTHSRYNRALQSIPGYLVLVTGARLKEQHRSFDRFLTHLNNGYVHANSARKLPIKA